MKIVFTLARPDHDQEITEAAEYVTALQRDIERKLRQGFPGAMLERGDGCIWVRKVEIVLDTGADKPVT